MPQIINVIELVLNQVANIHSFIIDTKEDEALIVKQAENVFIGLCKENGLDCNEIEEGYIIEDSYYTDDNGYEIVISWSNQVYTK